MGNKVDKLIEQFGEDLHILSDDKIKTDVDVISTNSMFLDAALGIGGIPMGRITELWGPNASGKTTLCKHLCINAQKKYPDKHIAFIDTEHAIDKKYAEHLGMDLDRALISQPDTGERAIEIADTLIRSNQVSIVIVDSVAGLTPQAELEGAVSDQNRALVARLLHKSWRILKDGVRKTNTALVFTNQISTQAMGYITFSGPGGGQALKFASSVRMGLSKEDMITVGQGKDKVALGQIVKVKIEKNKLAAPHRECKFYLIYGEGISKLHDVLDIAFDAKILTKSGNWVKYGEDMIGNGKTQAIDYIKNNDEFREKLTKEVEEYYLEHA